MSIADKIRNIYIEKKKLKEAIKNAGGSIDNDTIFADYPEKIEEAFLLDKFYTELELEFIKLYYNYRRKNNAWEGSTLEIIDLTPFPFNNSIFDYYFSSSKSQKIILPEGEYEAYSIEGIFKDCINLKEIENINSIDTRIVTDLSECFMNCSSLEYLDLSSWQTRNAKFASDMFRYCTNLKYLDIRNFEFIEILDQSDNHYYMFWGMDNLETLRLDNCNTDTATYIIDRIPKGAPCTIYCSQSIVDIVPHYSFNFVGV